MKPSPRRHSLNNMRSVSVIIARESEVRPSKGNGDAAPPPFPPYFSVGVFRSLRK